ncbi:hypothetical protein RFI_06939 [Reticulomyxa filosa]|uniref:peptidylprolyl isomerase n=1 Tax=Reticulomyxa filosa TaxID=46433 RepID=X6NWH4_RETFI|nr:hypothetical protein RFI_06939 [Reticulomyxa filosa]|eukprot:ETO30179.1 hypothetical protein RFI_06939 [Reticulomyxa filosa]
MASKSKKPQQQKEEPEEEILSEEIEDAEETAIDLFWKGTVKPGEPLVVSNVEEYFVRITNACLGPDSVKGTRTSLTITQQSDENDESPQELSRKNVFFTCLLDTNNTTESVQLNVSGEKPSSVYLVGYLSPADQFIGEAPFDLGSDIEDVDDDVEMEESSAVKKQGNAGRKRNLSEVGGNEEATQSAAKKQKVKEGQAKPATQTKPAPQAKPAAQAEKPAEKPVEKPAEKAAEKAAEKPVEKPAEKPAEKPVEKKEASNQNNKNQKKKNQAEKKNQQAEKKNEKPTEVVEAKEEPKAAEQAEPAKGKEPAAQDNKKKEEEEWKKGPEGLKFRDLRVGDGKKGSKVTVFYVGQLPNKKVFDKLIDGEGFEFKVGGGEVIQGWEKGLLGMKVGGKRRLLIPAKLGYGEEGSEPDIPPNTDLTFTIEVKTVN